MSMKKRPRSNRVEYRMARSLDTLAELEALEEQVMPTLRKAVSEGWTAEQILSNPKIAAMMAARQVTIALTDKDNSKALSAIVDAQNRIMGKPTERKEIAHKYAKLKDEQLDSLLMSEFADLEDGDADESSEH
jgi:hypothetical protein